MMMAYCKAIQELLMYDFPRADMTQQNGRTRDLNWEDL